MRKRRSRSKSKRSTTRRRRRRNGAGMGRTAFLALMAAGKRKKARSGGKRRKSRAKRSTKRARKSRSGRRIRPTIILSRGKLYRPRRSKYFSRPRKVNGRRRRRSNGSGSLVRAVKGVFQVRTISRYASIGGGIFLGTLFSRLLNTGVVPFTALALPAALMAPLQKLRPIHGLLHMALGALVASKVRNKYAQDAAIGIAALGGFDLVTQVLSRVGVVGLPTFSGMNVDLVSGRTMYSGMNVSMRPMAGMNVDLKGMARSYDSESDHLADNINDMLS